MISVLHVIDKLSVSGSGLHGISRALADWGERLRDHDVEMHVLSLRGEEPEGEALFAEKGVPLTCVSLGKMDPRSLSVIRKHALACNAQILHLHGYAAAHFGRLLSMWMRIPNIVHEHVVFPSMKWHEDLADRIFAPLTTQGLAISKPVEQFMIEKRHIPAAKLETFFYGLPLEEWSRPPEDELLACREQLQGSDQALRLIAVGRLATQKNLPSLLQVHAELLEEFPDLELLIVGEGPERAHLESLAGKQVQFSGFQRDVRPWLALSDVFVIPSDYEGGPLTLFEAMRLGLPCVSTPVGLVPEAIEEGKTGFLFPPGNVEALKESLRPLLQDESLRRRIGEAARVSSERWDMRVAVEQLTGVYRRLIPGIPV